MQTLDVMERKTDRLFAETMLAIGQTLNSTLDIERVLALIVDNIERLVAHSHANIMLLEDDDCTLCVVQYRGYAPESAYALQKLRMNYRESRLFMQAARENRPLIIDDVRENPDWIFHPEFDDIYTFATMPIIADDELFGFINLDGTAPGELDDEVAYRLHIFAQQAALAIRNARLYEQTRQQAAALSSHVQSLTIAQRLYKEISFSPNTRAMLEIAFDAALRLTMADGGYVALLQDGRLNITHCYGEYALDELASIINDHTGIVGAVMNEARPQAAPPLPLVSALTGAKAQIGLPLYARSEDELGAFYGILVLETRQPERFTEDRVQLLTLIADRVTGALQNTRLMTTLRERAVELEAIYDRLSQLEQLKSDMIRIAAHDLKNPLMVIDSYAKLMMKEDGFRPDTAVALPAIKRSTERMSQIIQNFLSLDRIQRIAEHQIIEPFDLGELAIQAVEELRDRALMKTQRLEIDLPDCACIVNGDAVQMYEAITNFISNAIKYTPDSGHIQVELMRTQGNYIRLEVRDNGYGIPLDKQAKLFQPFYRAITRETREIEGTGLGLHLTKSIIERQGGTMVFNSVYGEGSTFGFEMALLPASAMAS